MEPLPPITFDKNNYQSLVFQGFFYALNVIFHQGKSISHATFCSLADALLQSYKTDTLT